MSPQDASPDSAVPDFAPVLVLIQQVQGRALAGVNRELIGLYWQAVHYLSERVGTDGWGRGTAQQLAGSLAGQHAGLRGFFSANLWRMRQFYDTYNASPTLAPLVRELSWTNNLTTLGRANTEQERECHLCAAVLTRRWSSTPSPAAPAPRWWPLPDRAAGQGAVASQTGRVLRPGDRGVDAMIDYIGNIA